MTTHVTLVNHDYTTRKQTFHPVSIFAFSPGIFVFGTKETISPGCILKQGYKVPAPSVWRRQATISPGWTLQPGINFYSRLEAPAGTKG